MIDCWRIAKPTSLIFCLVCLLLLTACDPSDRIPISGVAEGFVETPAIIYRNPSIRGTIIDVVLDGGRAQEIFVEGQPDPDTIYMAARVTLQDQTQVFIREANGRYRPAARADFQVGQYVEVIFVGMPAGLDPAVAYAKEIILIEQPDALPPLDQTVKNLAPTSLPTAAPEAAPTPLAVETTAELLEDHLFIPAVLHQRPIKPGSLTKFSPSDILPSNEIR